MGSEGLRFEYIIHFTAPFRDPRLDEVEFEDHLYFVKMTQGQADQLEASMQRMFNEGFIVHSFSVALAEATRITPMDLRRRLTYYKHQSS